MSSNIKGITIEFRGNATPLQKAIRTVDKELRNTTKELTKVNKALKFNPTSVDLWRQKQQLLTNKVKETDDKLKSLKQAQAQMDAAGVDKNSEEYRKLQREIIETESQLKTFKAQLREVGNYKLTALGQQFKKAGKQATELGKTITMKVSAPLAALGTVAVKKFAEVDKTMTLVNATMKNSEEEAALLDGAMKSAAANSTYGMNEAATATLNFARAGLNAKETAAALAPAMALAAGEGGNLDVVSQGLVGTINGFGDSFDQTSHYADVFANACNNSALSVDALSGAMSIAAPVFHAAGYEVEDAALYMGVMANNGIEASVAANSLKTGFSRLISPSKEGAAWMDKLGISVTNADGTMKSSVEIQKELHDSFMALSDSERIAAAQAIFGKNQMAPWLALINAAPEDVAALNDEIGKNGTAMDMQAAQMEGFAGSIEKLKSGIDVLAVSLGQALAPTIQKVAGWIQKLVDWFNSLSPEAQKIIAVIMLIIAAAGPLLVIIGTLASSIGSIISVVGMLTTAMGALNLSMLPIIAIVALIIAICILLYKNWDKIKAQAIDLRDSLIKLWNEIKTNVTTAVQDIKNKVTTVFKAIKNTVTQIWNSIKTAITSPIQTAVNVVRTAINKIKSIINGAKLKLPRFKLPHFKISGGKLPWGIGGKGTPPKMSVDWYEKGGIFNRPTIAGIGEAGPEAVVPLNTLWKKLDNIAEAAGSGGAPVINIYAQPGQNVRQLAKEVGRVLADSYKREEMAWK